MGVGTRTDGQTDTGLASLPIEVPGVIALQAVMGSHAYGLARAGSDIDTKGVYVATTLAMASLNPPKDTLVHTDPDYEFHELSKFCRLALKCNPTVLELLWRGDYQVMTDDGARLVINRTAFLSRDRVKRAFGGYATDQINRLMKRNDGSFSSTTRGRREKHARHCFRLFEQGRQLLETGTMNIVVSDPERLFAISKLDDAAMLVEFKTADAGMVSAYENSSLPEKADFARIHKCLHAIRKANIGD